MEVLRQRHVTRDSDLLEDRAGRHHRGGIRKTIWFHEDGADALRLRAFGQRRSEPSPVREAVRKLLEIADGPSRAYAVLRLRCPR